MTKRFLLILAGIICLSFAAHAADEVVEPNPSKYPVLERLRGKDKELTYDFLGESHGVDAWLLSGPSMMQMVYTVPGKDFAMVGGALVSPEGKETSREMLQDFMKKYPKRSEEILKMVRSSIDAVKKSEQAKTKNSPSEILWQNLDRTGKITFGRNTDGAELYAIVDPEQELTKEIWQHLSPVAEKNGMTLHMVPLALTTGDSIMTIATMLGSKDPANAWEQLMLGNHPEDKESTPDPRGVLGMKATVDFAQGMKLRDLPLIVYRLPGQNVRILRGAPKDWAAFIQSLQPKQ